VYNGTVTPTLETITRDIRWPNQATYAPFNATHEMPFGVLAASGFFVNEKKATGTVSMFDEFGKELKISTDEKDFFYHQAEFMDVDEDGLLDIVAARTHKTLIGAANTEFIWMKQPAVAGQPWITKVLIQGGPGVAFALVDLDGDGQKQIVATEFFSKQDIAVYWCTNGAWSNCGPDYGVMRTLLGSGDGSYFNVEWVDLNGDGKKDLLTTTNSKNGAVFGYEQPSNWRTMPWGKHVLSDGQYIPTKSFLPGRGSPGIAMSFRTTSTGSKPSIFVSADDGGFVMLVEPVNDADKSNWEYTSIKFYEGTGTIGSPTIGDLNGDGFTDAFFIPDYAQGKLLMYKVN